MEQQDQAKQFFHTVEMANLLSGVVFDKRLLITSFEQVVEGIGKHDIVFASELKESKGFTLFLDPIAIDDQVHAARGKAYGQAYMHPRPNLNQFNLNMQMGYMQATYFGIAPHGSSTVWVVPACLAGAYGANQQTPVLFDMVIRALLSSTETQFNRGFVNQ